MKTILINKKGSSLVSVLVIGAVLITSGMFILKQTQDSQKRKTQIEYKIQENQIEDTLVHTLSNKEICTNIFNGYVSSDGTKIQFKDLSDLKNKIRTETKSYSIFENLDYEVESINYNSALGINTAKNVETANASLTIKVIRDSKVMALLKKSTHSVLKLEIPLNFEFDIDNANRKLMSCSAISKDAEFIKTAKTNCEAFGGSLDANQKCVFKVNELRWDDPAKKFQVDTRNDLDLQDMLCKIDNSVTQKLRTTTTDDLYSEYCPKVQYNGCIVNGVKYKNGDSISYSYQGKKAKVYERANVLQYQSTYLRYLRHSSNFELAGIDFSKVDMNGTYIKQKSTSKSGLATGMVGAALVGNMLSAGFLLSPIIIMKMEEWICGNKYRGTVHSQCIDGHEEMISVQVDRRRMKKFKCKWKSDGIVQAEPDGKIITNLVQLIDGQMPNVNPTYSDLPADESEDQKFKDLSELKKQFNDALSSYASISNIDDFYAEIKEFKMDSAEKLFGDDKEGVPPEVIDLEKYIDQEIRKLEIKRWEELRNSIKAFAYNSNSYSNVASYMNKTQSSINNSSSLLVSVTPAESNQLAQKELNTQQESLLSTIESRINGATTLNDLEYYGDPASLRGNVSPHLSSRLNGIIAKYKSQKEYLTPKKT